MPKKTSVEYVKQAVPAFLQRFKEETGYREDTIEDKNKVPDKNEKDAGDRDDERPQVVQLSANDLTAEEAKTHWDSEEAKEKVASDEKDSDDEPDDTGGRIMFKKPTKRSSSEQNTSSSKKKKTDTKENKKEKKKAKSVKNTKLLSFDCDDDEET